MLITVAATFLLQWVVSAQPRIRVVPVSTPQLGQRYELRVLDLPVVANPFDPEVIRVDATFLSPSGKAMEVPAFWYQAYQRSLSGSQENLAKSGAAEWRLRYCPAEAGTYSVSVLARTNGIFYGPSVQLQFVVPDTNSLPAQTGYVRVAPGRQYLETGDGQALRLIGHNVCWHHAQGTYDYDAWFNAMAGAGENFARIWMWPNAFGLETDKDSLNRYRLDRAWQLDYVMQLAERLGIKILLCLDYHGMFQTVPDYWGGNNYWPAHPYNQTNGGPCLNQNAFFTNGTAQVIYQKRLRYLVARYGYSPSLLAWEFFNEIDNVYSYLNNNDVANWHSLMGRWFKANDPFGHLVTTSLTGNSDREELWSVPELDFTAYHSYGETQPASRLSAVAQSFLKRYDKPVMIGEFGTDWRGWNRSSDPYLRGFRQGLWGGALGGSMGSTMSWWWENIHSENLYPLFRGMTNFLGRTGWARGTWTNVSFVSSGPPPYTVDAPVPGGEPFSVTLVLASGWGAKPSGRLAVADPASANYAAANLNCFVHGTSHADLRVPFRLHAWLTNDARLVLHLNSVSQGAIMSVRVNSAEILRTNLANLDGAWTVTDEYNLDIVVPLPAGKKTIDVVNAGADWFYLDWVRLENALPATYTGGWQPSVDSIGLTRAGETLVYVVAPGVSFPAGATNTALPLQRAQSLTLTNIPSGPLVVDWFTPTNGALVTTARAGCTNGLVILTLPDFYEDLVGRLTPAPQLKALGPSLDGKFSFQFQGAPEEAFTIETSRNLLDWAPFWQGTNLLETRTFVAPVTQTNTTAFFRARRG